MRAAEEGAGCALCFPAGTLVATPHGARAIQSLHAGDTVLAEDPKTGTVEAEAVQATIQDPRSPLIAVALSDGSAITVTADHPFWVDTGEGLAAPGWIAAGHLRPGDVLRTATGTDVVVDGLRYHVGYAVVYTLTVARDHTFFIGSARVLVHNSNCKEVGDAARAVGAARVQRVVEHFGSEVVETGRRIKVAGVGSSDVDVVLTGKRYIEVGGPAKGLNLSDFGTQLKVLKEYARQEGGQAFFYYDTDTPKNVIDFAVKRLGVDNVKPIP